MSNSDRQSNVWSYAWLAFCLPFLVLGAQPLVRWALGDAAGDLVYANRLAGQVTRAVDDRPAEHLLPAPPPQSAKETEWSRWIAESMGGESEHQTYNQRRVDVLLHNRAIEVEWCKKEKISEAIRQAQYYAASTGRPGAVVLLTGRDDYSREREVYDQAVQAAARSGVLAVSWIDVRDPLLGVMCEHLGLVPTPATP